jgi:hypothetical protein
MSPFWRYSFVVLAACVALPNLAAQQSTGPTSCTLVQQPSTRLSADTLPNGQQIAFVGGGVLLKCPSRGITLRGDSAEQYPDRNFLIGHVVYDEPRFHLTSDFLTHFPADERIVAAGNVNAKLPSGSTLVGPVAEYRRPVAKIRDRRQVLATQRPTITIVETDSAGKPAPPMTVVANQVFMDGDSLLYAGGQVVINRPDIGATSDSAFIDETRETMRLMRTPRIKSTKDRPFTLSGDLIDLFSKDRKLQRVIARAHAMVVSDSMTITSDTIDLRMKNDFLDHAYAWGATSRARAVSPSQNMLADSLDVTMPKQRVELVRAIRKAFAQGRPDTTRFRLEKPDTTDWLQGDTITAHFDTATVKKNAPKGAPKDTSNAPNIKQLVASGGARSLYHMAPSDTAERRPAINHVIARIITIDFDQEQKVSTVTTVDSVFGVYIEPRSASDSTRRGSNAPTKPGPTNKPLPKSIVPIPPPPKKP